MKYSQAASEIRVHLAQRNGQLQPTVQDNGLGTASEHQQRIFDKFYRVASGDVHHVKGHRLGLSYAAGVVRKHGGGIEVESRVGEGSRFTVNLVALQQH